MAIFEKTIQNKKFDQLLWKLENEIPASSWSAELEAGSDFKEGGAQCSVRVFERYSVMGGNRLSLTLTMFQNGDSPIRLSAITAGGSQAVFFKVNTLGEESFLIKVIGDLDSCSGFFCIFVTSLPQRFRSPEWLRCNDCYIYSDFGTSYQKAVRNVVTSISKVCNLQTFQVSEFFFHGKEHSQTLCRMCSICQTIPYRNSTVLCKYICVSLFKSTEFDSIEHSSKYTCCIFDTLFIA